MRCQATRDAEEDLRMFWAVHRAYSAAKSDEGAEAGTEYVDNLNEILGIKKEAHKLSHAEENAMLNLVGIKPIQ